MLFNFELRSLAEVSPWGEPGRFHLSWFGLTDGWYWLDTGSEELFRYTDALIQHWIQHWQQTHSEPVVPTALDHYADYYVVRLWEDMLELLPAALEPLPAPLVTLLASPTEWAAWYQRFDQKWDREDEEDVEITDLYVDAIQWWNERGLKTGYLRAGPKIWLWTDGTTLTMDWDNRGLEIAGQPAWTATRGRLRLPVASFIEALTSFDTRLLAAMAQRIAEIRAGWPRPEVFIDLERLQQEQQERATWLGEALHQSRVRPPTRWDQVLDRLQRIDRR